MEGVVFLMGKSSRTSPDMLSRRGLEGSSVERDVIILAARSEFDHLLTILSSHAGNTQFNLYELRVAVIVSKYNIKYNYRFNYCGLKLKQSCGRHFSLTPHDTHDLILKSIKVETNVASGLRCLDPRCARYIVKQKTIQYSRTFFERNFNE